MKSEIESSEEDLPKQIGRYQVQRVLGEGAMGTVYLGIDSTLDRQVAIKTLTAGRRDQDLLRRFQVEARAIARLNHRNIAQIYECDIESDPPFFAMEYVEGCTLEDLISEEAENRPSLSGAVDLTLQICDGLQAAHAHGLVHRDIKPSNILVSKDGVAKIADFGIVRTEDSNLTQTGAVLGTPYYMSPEQIEGKETDARSDLFSLGSVFYELLTSHKAFPGKTIPAVVSKIVNAEFEDPSLLDPRVPSAVNAILSQTLAKHRDQRASSAMVLAEVIRQAVIDGLVQTENATAPIDREAATIMASDSGQLTAEGLSATAKPAETTSPAAPRPDAEAADARAGHPSPKATTRPLSSWPGVFYTVLFAAEMFGLWVLVQSGLVASLTNLFVGNVEATGLDFLEGWFAPSWARFVLVGVCAAFAFFVIDGPARASSFFEGLTDCLGSMVRFNLLWMIFLFLAGAALLLADNSVGYW